MVSLKYSFGVAAGQTYVLVTLAKCFKLLSAKSAQAGVLRGSPLATLVGLGLANFLGVIFSPLLAASYYLVTVALVMLTLRSAQAFFVLCRPSLLVLTAVCVRVDRCAKLAS
jgi:hypothetical protein